MKVSSASNIASRAIPLAGHVGTSVTVKLGDTLGKIAKQHNISLQDLLDANPHKKANPHLIRPGEIITIPPTPQSGAQNTATPSISSHHPAGASTNGLASLDDLIAKFLSQLPGTGSPTVTVAPQTVTVAKGDSLSAIAQRFGVSTDALRNANGLHPTDDRSLSVGKALRLPEGAKEITNKPAVQASSTNGKASLQDKAWQTALSYNQGDIAGLDEQHTRALVASTVETESKGGELGITNRQGYLGRYQASASWLAAAELIRGGADAVIKARTADGFKNDWSWAVSGGMTRFLEDDSNWVEDMSYEKYLASADIQDAAFKKNSDILYNSLKNQGFIKENTSQAEIAGLLKAGHIGGLGAAITVAKGGTGSADANGTTPRKYYNDLAQRGSMYLERNTPMPSSAQPTPVPTEKPTIANGQVSDVIQATAPMPDQKLNAIGEQIAKEAKNYLYKTAENLSKSEELPAMKRNYDSNCANFVSAVLVKLGLLKSDEHEIGVEKLRSRLQNSEKNWIEVKFRDDKGYINLDSLREGDIVFMQKQNPRISHVEFIVKNEKGDLVAIGSNGDSGSQSIYYHTTDWWKNNTTTVLRHP